MAVTITSSPQAFTPSDNPVTWTFSSTEFAQANFQFLVEVYVNAALRSRHIVFPEVNSNTAHFDAEANKITNLICSQPAPDPSTLIFAKSAANNATIYIKVIEQYGTPIASYLNASSATIRVFKASLNDNNFVNYLNTDYIWNGGAGKKFMTLIPRTEYLSCALTENLWVLFMTNSTALNIRVSIYVGGIGSSNTVAITNSVTSPISLINVGVQSIIDNTPFVLSSFTGASHYTIEVTVGGVYSEIFRINYDEACTNFGIKRLHFLTSIGSIDAFSFTKVNDTSRTIQHFGMEKQWGGFNSSNVFVYNNNQGREVDYLTTSSGRLTASTDWLSQVIQNWLVDELYESPFVLLETTSGTVLKRVKVLNTSSRQKQNILGNLFSETVELNLSESRKSALIQP